MKQDVNLIVNKILSYAFDNLLLDALDETYMLNRLGRLCGIAAPVRVDADYGDATLETLVGELKAAVPSVNVSDVVDTVFPMPRTVNYYFADALVRDSKKAFDFLYELCGCGYKNLCLAPVACKDGYAAYCGDCEPISAVILPACDNAVYAPLVDGNRLGLVEKRETLVEETLRRMAEYVTAYGGAIAARTDDYAACKDFALCYAAAKTKLSDGTVKIDLLDYPAPALALYGIAKNSALREAARIAKAADAQGAKYVLAASSGKDGLRLYIVFANIPAATDCIIAPDALAVCGVFKAPDYTALLPVLEKGTALSTDLAGFKPVYDKIGGVKLGAKALAALGGAFADIIKPAIAAAASVTEQDAAALAAPKTE